MNAKRILLVDDDPVTLLAVGRLLERQGYNVTRCVETAESVALALRGAWDLIILDLHLPSPKPGLIVDFDGLKMLSWIERLKRGIPVILFTAGQTTDLQERVRATGAFAVVGKGEEPRKLLEAVRQALELVASGERSACVRTDRHDQDHTSTLGSCFRALLKLFC